MTELAINHKNNLILSALTAYEYARIASHLEYVELPLGKVLYDPEEPIRHAYFPLQGAVSIVTVLRDGGSVEAGVIGNEGVVGLPIVLGAEMELNRRAQVQLAGSGLKVKASALQNEFKRGERLHDLLLHIPACLYHTAFTDGGLQPHASPGGAPSAVASGLPGSFKLG